jgi:hypothetical protein
VTHIVLFDRLSPWRKPHRSRAMRALAPAVQPPASGRGQRMRLSVAPIEGDAAGHWYLPLEVSHPLAAELGETAP